MIVDTSALASILFGEPEREMFTQVLASSDRTDISAGSWIELAVVFHRRGSAALVPVADRLILTFGINVVAVDQAQAAIARDAHRAFGQGSGHPAQLNFGDCFSYALAKATGRPLLFKGADFSSTDILKVVSESGQMAI